MHAIRLRIFILALVLTINQASAAEVSITPSSKSVTQGESFNLNVSIDPMGIAIAGAQLNIAFDKSIISANSVTEGNLFKQNGASTFFNNGTINNPAGTAINIYSAIIGPYNVSTQGTFIIINMTAISASGTSWINLSNVKISDPNGNYVALNVTNGIVSTSQQSSNPAQPPSGGGGSSGGGGGGAGGASGENYTNIELNEKYDLFIYKDVTTSYCFRKVGNPIICVNITGNTNAGEINTAVEVLRNTSSLVKTSTDGIIYKNVNIWVGTSGFATSQNIKDAVVTFGVNKSWIDENSLDPASIVLMRYSNGWIELPTRKISEKASEVIYEARTESFGHFAIASKKSGFESYSQLTSGSKSVQKNESAIKNNAMAASRSEGLSNLAVFLLIGLFVGSIVAAGLVLKIGKLR